MRYLIVHIAAVALIALSGAASAKTVKECSAEYAANKAALKGVQSKADFMTACKAGTETIPGGPAAAPGPTAQPAPAPAPPPAAPKPAAPKPTAANEFSTEALADAHCPGAIVVWVNLKSKIYHFKGTKDFGTTKKGAYMCEAEAMNAGDRAAKNEKHP